MPQKITVPPPAKKILIIKLGALGDIILSTPCIQIICNSYPNANIHLLTSPAFESLFKGDHRLQVKTSPRKGFTLMLRLLAWIRSQRFDALYDLQGNDRTAFLSILSGIPFRAGQGKWPIYTHRPNKQQRANRQRHALPRMAELMQACGLPAPSKMPVLHISNDAEQKTKAWLKTHQLLDTPWVIVHAGGSQHWESKRWPAQSFIHLALILKEKGYAVVWIGGADEIELNQSLAKQVGIDATQRFNLTEIAALARHARFAIVNDSGPMHLISTANIPVYAFFGPTNWQRSHAAGQERYVIRHPVECSPCFLPQCPEDKKHACLTEITPEDVTQRIDADGNLD